MRAFFALLVIMICLSGCSGGHKVPAVQVKYAAEGGEPFLLEEEGQANYELYIENFQRALNAHDIKKISSFIAARDETANVYISYLSDKSMQRLIKFYLGEVELKYLKTVQFGGIEYLAVESTFYDNRYNDFHSIELVRGETPRDDFYDSVTAMLAKQEERVAAEESDKNSLKVQEDLSIPTTTSQIGINYNDTNEIVKWAEFLEDNKDKLTKFTRVMFFRVVSGAEYSLLEIDTGDLVSLFGSLPVFFSLNSKYTIDNYDLYYNFTQMIKELPDEEQKMFSNWDKIAQMSDEEIKQLSELEMENELVFGVYDIDDDIEKIRQNLFPAELSLILEGYYNSSSRAYYVFLHENKEYARLERNLLSQLKLELIKQNEKEFTVLTTLPDINQIMIGAKNGLSTEEAVIYINDVIESGDFTTVSVYSSVVLQKSAGTKWGFKLMKIPMAEFLADTVHSKVLEVTGIGKWLGASLDRDGFVQDDSQQVIASSRLFS